MKNKVLKNSLTILGVMLSTCLIAISQAKAASSVDVFGIQVLEGELAFAVYNTIQGEASPVRDLDGGGLVVNIKEIGQLSCFSNISPSMLTCFVSELGGGMPKDIPGSAVNKKLYDILNTRALPMGVDFQGNGTPTGHLKTVAKIDCTQDLKTGEFGCNIYFRKQHKKNNEIKSLNQFPRCLELRLVDLFVYWSTDKMDFYSWTGCRSFVLKFGVFYKAAKKTSDS